MMKFVLSKGVVMNVVVRKQSIVKPSREYGVIQWGYSNYWNCPKSTLESVAVDDYFFVGG